MKYTLGNKKWLAFFILIGILGFILGVNIRSRTVNGCGSSNNQPSLTTGVYKYKMTNENVCYHKDCSFYDFFENNLCYMHERWIGYQKLEGADPNTFTLIRTSGVNLAVNSTNMYFADDPGGRSLTETAYKIGILLEFCESGEKEYSKYNNDLEKVQNMCKHLKDKFTTGQGK